VDARGGEADDGVASLDAGAVDQRIAVHDADAGRGEVQLILAVHARELGGLAADQSDAGGAAHLRRALDELGDLLELDRVRGDVVEQDQRLGPDGDHIIDAVRSHVLAAEPERTAWLRNDWLRSDRVGRGGEIAPVAERMQSREGAELPRARRLDRRAEAFDDRSRGRERHAGGLVRRLSPGQESECRGIVR